MRIIRASSIGHPCIRKIWYEMNGDKPLFGRKTLRIFDIGNALEEVVVNDLKSDNWEVIYNKGSQESDLETNVYIGNDAVISGHPDICMKRSSSTELSGNFLADIKTMRATAFSGWKASGTIAKYPQYADQLTAYWAGLKETPVLGWEFESMAVVGLNKDTSDIHIDVLEFDSDRLVRMIDKARYIALQDSPPDPGEVPKWTCSYCGFNSICTRSFGCFTTKQSSSKEVTEVLDESVISAATRLMEAKRLKAEAEAAEKEAKALLTDYAARNSISKFKAGNVSISMRSSPRTSIDTAALEDQYPEIARQFKKTVSYTIVNAVDMDGTD